MGIPALDMFMHVHMHMMLCTLTVPGGMNRPALEFVLRPLYELDALSSPPGYASNENKIIKYV